MTAARREPADRRAPRSRSRRSSLTLPLALNLKRALPSDHSDTLLTTWIIGWDADRLRHGLRGLWDAPIFFPYRGTLAFSENHARRRGLRRAGLLDHRRSGADLQRRVPARVRDRRRRHVPARARADRQPRRARSPPACTTRSGRSACRSIAHVQMVATGWIPIALCGLHRYFATRRRAGWRCSPPRWILQTLSNMYVGYFIAVPIAVVVADGVWRARRARTRIAAAAGGRRPARRRRARAGRRSPTTARARAITRCATHRRSRRPTARTCASYVVGKNSVGVWRWLPTAVGVDPEKELFPGLFAARPRGVRLCDRRPRSAAPALGDRLRRGRDARQSSCRSGRTCGSGARVVTTHGPYALAARDRAGDGRHARPGAIRDHRHRGAVGAGRVRRRLAAAARQRARFRSLIPLACVAMVVADGWASPIATVAYSARGRPEDRAVAFWLADRAPGAVLHLPMQPCRRAAARLSVHDAGARSSDRQRLQRIRDAAGRRARRRRDRRSTISSGFRRRCGCFASLGVRYVIVHPGDYDGAARTDGSARSHASTRFEPRGQIAKEAGLPEVDRLRAARRGRRAGRARAMRSSIRAS